MWGEKALFAMIEICLNPENDMIAGEILKPIVDKYVGLTCGMWHVHVNVHVHVCVHVDVPAVPLTRTR